MMFELVNVLPQQVALKAIGVGVGGRNVVDHIHGSAMGGVDSSLGFSQFRGSYDV